jgi:glycosyltransferase involved in cell wall biosynthesis
MNRKRSRVVLATDSLDPSGMGEHMLTLAASLNPCFDIAIAAFDRPGVGLLSRAARSGLAVKGIEDFAAFERWLATADIGLLHVHAGIGWEGHDLARAGRACGIPVIRTEHLPYLLTDTDQQQAYAEQAREVSHHIAVSEASRQSYVAKGVAKEQMTVVQNGIVPLGAAAGEEKLAAGRGKTLLNVARFSRQKDHATLIRAMPAVIRKHPSTTLLLAGQGEERDAVEALAAALGVRQNVQFLGQRTDVAALMADADLFVLPSRFEGLPLVVLEAMSLGLPIVATRIGGTVEALGADHPYLVESGDPRAACRHADRGPERLPSGAGGRRSGPQALRSAIFRRAHG